MSDQPKGLSTLLGLTTFGLAVVGIAGFIGALFPFFEVDYVGAGLLLLASALAFGSLSRLLLGR